jgi:inositol oxygenase
MNNKHNRFGLIDLFGGNRWVRPPKEITKHLKQYESEPGLASEFFTLRMEHRNGGTLATHDGEERVLRFRSDKAGAIAKVIFSSSPVIDQSEDNGEDNGEDNIDDSSCQPQHPADERKQTTTIAANATIHVLFVKDAHRGFNLGGLLFALCTTCLRKRYCGSSNNKIYSGIDCQKTSASSIRCRLDAEEDIRRHGKLVHFYEHLGLRKRERAKPNIIHNNDGESYRRIPMKMDLMVSPSPWKIKEKPQQQLQQSDYDCSDENINHIDDIAAAYSSFLPALLVSASGECARVDNRSIDSWFMVECPDGKVELRTTDGRMLRPTDDNCKGESRCKLVVPTNMQRRSSSCPTDGFQLLRVSDVLGKVFCDKEEERSCIRDYKLLANENENENELWMLRSASSCGTEAATFLGMTANDDLIVSPEASFWQADENFCLTHTTSDSPAHRQHHRRMWKQQSVAYATEMRTKHSAFALGTMTIEDALLHLAKHLPANPFSSSSTQTPTPTSTAGGRTRIEASSLRPSIRTLLFHTAELARNEGHPDWVQFIALVHGLAGVLTCLGTSGSTTSSAGGYMPDPLFVEPPPGDNGKKKDDEFDFGFDWTIYVDARVMGCKASKHSTFAEFRHLNPDRGDARYNTKDGLYNEHVGLEHVLLSWTSCDYMYAMLKHNNVLLPKEAYAILKLFPLVDWHTRGKHTSLSNETDEERKPFVADFYEMFQRSRDKMIAMTNNTSNRKEMMMSGEECKKLWTNHYSLIANKYGAGGILEW